MAGLEYSASVWWAGLVVVWWVLSGCVCVCLQDSQVWRGLTCQAQSRTQAVVHLTLLKVSRGQAAADCRDHFSCNACIVELALLDLVYMLRSTLAVTLLKIIALPVPLLRQVHLDPLRQ